MPNSFQRFPIDGGDNNAWGPIVLAQEYHLIGEYSSYLFDDAGTLKVSAGGIGIYDGTNKGTCEIVETAIALTGTTGIWQKIEIGVSGANVTFYSTDLAGETDPAVLPAAFTGGYSAAKRGYYIIGTRRTLGVVWVDSNGDLYGVVNSNNGIYGYNGYSYLDDSGGTIGDVYMEWDVIIGSYKRQCIIYISNLNMDTTATKSTLHYLPDLTKVKSGTLTISNNVGTRVDFVDSSDGDASFYMSGTFLTVDRLPGGRFDAAAWNAANLWAKLDMFEE